MSDNIVSKEQLVKLLEINIMDVVVQRKDGFVKTFDGVTLNEKYINGKEIPSELQFPPDRTGDRIICWNTKKDKWEKFLVTNVTAINVAEKLY